jgi:hypothetical protein
MIFGGLEVEGCSSKYGIRSIPIRFGLFLALFIGVPLIYGVLVL